MIEPLKAKQSLKAAELQDGDIICFQRMHEKKNNLLEKKLSFGDKQTDDRYVSVCCFSSNRPSRGGS